MTKYRRSYNSRLITMVAERKKPSSKDEQDSTTEKQSESNSSEEESNSGSEQGSDEESNRGSEQGNDEESDSESEQGSDEDSGDGGGSDIDSADDIKHDDEKPKFKPLVSASGEQCTFDLKNLLAINSHQVETVKLYSTEKTGDEEIVIPSLSTLISSVDEDHLLEKATDGCAQLINALWQLPTERSDVGTLVSLPSYSVTKLPRQLPPPPPKSETKWEKFAKARGIPLNKEKRSQKVWDEDSGSWKFIHGYNKANDDSKEWPIMEVKRNEDPFEDPWERVRDAKRTRVDKNTLNRMKNAQRDGSLDKGTAVRALKGKEKIRESGKNGNAVSNGMVPVGVPVDLRGGKGSDKIDSLKRGKQNTMKTLLATQRSTASLGKFDAMREGEPERKKGNLKKRKFESATDRKVVSTEAARSTKLLNAVINGGGKQRDLAKRKGRLAKGETAYDYDFDDGLSPSKFKKKKGRAGAGKIKKMTKKRIV